VLRGLKARLDPKLDYVVVVMPSSLSISIEDLSADVGSLIESVNERWAAESESS
jgi:hypothetical protein